MNDSQRAMRSISFVRPLDVVAGHMAVSLQSNLQNDIKSESASLVNCRLNSIVARAYEKPPLDKLCTTRTQGSAVFPVAGVDFARQICYQTKAKE